MTMRIAYLNPTGSLGGAEVSLLDILASLQEAEPQWSLRLITGSDGPLVKRARILGIPTEVVPFPPAVASLGDSGSNGREDQQITRLDLFTGILAAAPGVLAYIKRLRSALHDLAPDVIHTNGFKMHVLGLWARPQRVPVIWHIHDYLQPRPVMARLLRRCAPRCSAMVANSKSVAEDIRSTCGAGPEIHIVYNAVNLTRFSLDGPTLDLDALAGLRSPEKNVVRVGLLGTMAWWKGHKTFLEALSLLPPSLPIRAYVVGGALYQTNGSQHSLEDLRRFAAKLNISHKVGFTGFVDDPAAAMRALDLVVHASSRPEPFGLVIAEAMACGRAVIASYAGGAAELVEVGTNALGHPPGDASALATCILELTSNADLRVRLGKAGRATAESRFDCARLAKELVPIYRQATSSNYACSACA